MKTFGEAFRSLTGDPKLEFNPKPAMDRYQEMADEIAASAEVELFTNAFVLAVSKREISVETAVRVAFGQGVLVGIEMEKPQ